MLKTLAALLRQINDATHTPHKHDVQPLLKEMRRVRTALSRLERNAKQRIALYDALDALYTGAKVGHTCTKGGDVDA